MEKIVNPSLSLARYSVGLTEFEARLQDISFEQTFMVCIPPLHPMKPYKEAHKEEEARKGRVARCRKKPNAWKIPTEVPDLQGSFLYAAGTFRQRFLFLQANSDAEYCGSGSRP